MQCICKKPMLTIFSFKTIVIKSQLKRKSMNYTIENKLARPGILTYLQQSYIEAQSHCTTHNTTHPPPPPPRPNTGTRRNKYSQTHPTFSVVYALVTRFNGTPSKPWVCAITKYKHFYTGAYPVPTISISISNR